MDITMESDLSGLRGRLAKAAARANPGSRNLVEKYSRILLARTRQYALVETGRMRSGFDVAFTEGGFTATMTNSEVYWPRREKGFVGIDALGRHYFDPPTPMAQRAFEETWPEFIADLKSTVPGWLT